MPKMKTHKGAKARFKITAKGKLLRTRPGKRHILTKKTSKRKRHLKSRGLVHETLERTYLRMLGKA